MNPVLRKLPAESSPNRSATIPAAEFELESATDGLVGRGRRERDQSPGVTKLRRWLLRRLLEGLGAPPIAIALWNGETIDPRENRRWSRFASTIDARCGS